MISRIRQLWIQRKAMVVVALLSMGSGALLGAVRYSNRFPAIPTFEVKRGEFIDSVQFHGEVKALKATLSSSLTKQKPSRSWRSTGRL